MPEGLTPIALPPPNQPIRPHNHHHHKINSRHIIHISGSDRHVRRKAIRCGREERPAEENTVGKETERAEPEGTMSDIVAAADEKARNWNGIGYIEEDDAGCRHAVECCRTSEPKTSYYGYYDARSEVGIERNVQFWFNLG
jgi:hypothetical protein